MSERDLTSELNALLEAKDAALISARKRVEDLELQVAAFDYSLTAAERERDARRSERDEAWQLLAAVEKDRDEWKRGCVYSHEKRLEEAIEGRDYKRRFGIVNTLLRDACKNFCDSSNSYCGAWVSTVWIKKAKEACGADSGS